MAHSSFDTGTPWFAVSTGLAGMIIGFLLASGFQGIAAPTAPSAPGTVAQQPDTPTPAAPTPPPTTDTPAEVDDDPVLGDSSAPITLIEFTDYQCPFCSRHFSQTYPQIKSEYVDTGLVKMVVRDFPLSFHANAQKASEASECAEDQDQFWQMHDKLFSGQQEWSNLADPLPVFSRYAGELGMDTDTFETCVSDGTHAQEVRDDMAAGSASGIDGTPGFWILGPDGQSQKISGAYPFESFKAAFDGMME